MRLQEEYYRRHAMDSPYVRYDTSAALILRQNNLRPSPRDSKAYFWNVAVISYKPDSHHPGNYELSIRVPAHNSGNSLAEIPGRNFFDCIPWKSVSSFSFNWDDYEESVNKWALDQALSDMSPVIDPNEKAVNIWNIFAYCADYKLASLPLEITMDSMAETLLPFDNSISEKISAIAKVEDYLKGHDPDLNEKLKKLRNVFNENHYANWLGKLILHHRNAKESSLAGFHKELALD